MPEIETKDYKDGYKKFSSRAKRYADDPEKTKGLLKKATLKAEKNKSSLSDIWEKFQLLIEFQVNLRNLKTGKVAGLLK
ncbi:hypothetical protein ACOSZF_12730 [Cytobacillus firmus]|uniref:hypothetical protein n=1 Tax=Cytobacillus firmus TaxID=1399 RepID=UPI001F50B990|nr:hypothetical protein [Cytobacillus firmus]MED1940276.1 hypothetical protein [Cytobacillus firmus]